MPLANFSMSFQCYYVAPQPGRWIRQTTNSIPQRTIVKQQFSNCTHPRAIGLHSVPTFSTADPIAAWRTVFGAHYTPLSTPSLRSSYLCPWRLVLRCAQGWQVRCRTRNFAARFYVSLYAIDNAQKFDMFQHIATEWNEGSAAILTEVAQAQEEFELQRRFIGWS
jgi:hypothetical protein